VALAPASSHGVDTASANTWSGNQTAPAWIASGLTGATAASRYVGATASGAPASGKVFVCTSAGTPGTWVQVGAAGGVTILNYTEKTSSVTVSATTEGTPTVVVTASAGVVVDGSTLVCVEFGSPNANAAASSFLILNLWDDTAGASLGRIWASSIGTSGVSVGILARRYFTPAAGTRTYSIRGWRGSADATVTAGAAGATAYYPMYIRVTSGS
jgi:hypothetical protein